MRYLFILLLLAPNWAFSQCAVTSIIFGTQPICIDADTVFALPVTINYIGLPLQVEAAVTGLNYDLPNQTFLHANGNITFVIYLEDRQLNDVTVKAKLLNGTCNQDSLVVKHTPPPVCTGCPNVLRFLEADSLANQSNRFYLAKDTIFSSQIIRTTRVEMSAKNVLLLPGFFYETNDTSSLIINTNIEACEN